MSTELLRTIKRQIEDNLRPDERVYAIEPDYDQYVSPVLEGVYEFEDTTTDECLQGFFKFDMKSNQLTEF